MNCLPLESFCRCRKGSSSCEGCPAPRRRTQPSDRCRKENGQKRSQLDSSRSAAVRRRHRSSDKGRRQSSDAVRVRGALSQLLFNLKKAFLPKQRTAAGILVVSGASRLPEEEGSGKKKLAQANARRFRLGKPCDRKHTHTHT